MSTVRGTFTDALSASATVAVRISSKRVCTAISTHRYYTPTINELTVENLGI